jgi:DNA-binding ferritin-like protein
MVRLTPFLTTISQLKIFHWQTTSYAEHKALEKAYNNLDELFDSFVEVYYGKYGRPSDAPEYNIRAETYAGDIKETIKGFRDQLMNELNNLLNEKDSDLKNIKDEIESEFNRLLYLLSLN